MMTFEQITAEIRQLSIQERKQLIAVIVDTLTEDHPTRTRSILEFEGIGERLRDGTDAQSYVDRRRSEWDERA
jgi:hypothetical protein